MGLRGGAPPGHHGDFVCVGNLQPGLVLVSQSLKRIGLLDLCCPVDSLLELLAAARQRKLLASSGGAAVIFGKRVTGVDQSLGSGYSWDG